MFPYTHYVPVLRWRRAEGEALASLHEQDRAYVTPLIEVPPHVFMPPRPRRPESTKPAPDPSAVVARAVAGMATAWKGRRVFLDLHLLDKLGSAFGIAGRPPWAAVGRAVLNCGVDAVPVTSIRRPDGERRIVAALAARSASDGTPRGACLRVRQMDLMWSQCEAQVRRLLAELRLNPEQVDVVVDLEIYDDSKPSAADICRQLPFVPAWRSLTILSGHFPRYLTGFRKNDEHRRPRKEWRQWAREVEAGEPLPRRPAFGDYTVQHPVYYLPLGRPNPSSTLR